MEEPPFILDGARTVAFATIDPTQAPRGASAVASGVTLDLSNVRGLAVVESLADGNVYLLHCNDRWETLAAEGYGSVGEARSAGEHAYTALTPRFTDFRALTPAEEAELESTRTFLREIISDADEH